MFGRKKLKNRIAELEVKNTVLNISNQSLKNDVAELCEDYNSCGSIIIRMHYSLSKAFENEVFRGDATGTELKGILTQAQE